MGYTSRFDRELSARDHEPRSLEVTGDIREAGPEPLERSVRARVERAFGTSLSHVLVHRDSPDVSLGEQAFARGRDIYTEPGAFERDNERGGRVLAHELAHVAQRSAPGAALVDTRSDVIGDIEADAVQAALNALAGRAAAVRMGTGAFSSSTSTGCLSTAGRSSWPSCWRFAAIEESFDEPDRSSFLSAMAAPADGR